MNPDRKSQNEGLAVAAGVGIGLGLLAAGISWLFSDKASSEEKNSASHEGKFLARPQEGQSQKMPKLDLHGYHCPQAETKIREFLDESKGFKVEIITGRGQSSPENRPVLKYILEEILWEKGLKYHQRNEGGSYIIKNY